MISGSEPDSYFLEKPNTPNDSKYVTAAPKAGVKAVDLTGQASARPQPLVQKNYYIQVGVFSRKEAAQALAANMQGIGNVEIEPVFSGGMDLFRVRIGPATSRFDAKEIADKVLMRGHQDSYIIEE